MHSTVSIASSFMGSLLGISYTPPPHSSFSLSNGLSPHFTIEPLISAKISWTHHASSFRWLASETKRWNLGLTLRSPSLNKTGNLLPCHLTTVPSFLPCHLTPLPTPTFPKFPPHYLPTSLFSQLSHLATSLHSYTFPTFSAHYSPTFPAHLPLNDK